MRNRALMVLSVGLLAALLLLAGCQQPAATSAPAESTAAPTVETVATSAPEEPTVAPTTAPATEPTQVASSGSSVASGDASVASSDASVASGDASTSEVPLTRQVAKAGGLLGFGLVLGLLAVPSRPSWLRRDRS